MEEIECWYCSGTEFEEIPTGRFRPATSEENNDEYNEEYVIFDTEENEVLCSEIPTENIDFTKPMLKCKECGCILAYARFYDGQVLSDEYTYGQIFDM